MNILVNDQIKSSIVQSNVKPQTTSNTITYKTIPSYPTIYTNQVVPIYQPSQNTQKIPIYQYSPVIYSTNNPYNNINKITNISNAINKTQNNQYNVNQPINPNIQYKKI